MARTAGHVHVEDDEVDRVVAFRTVFFGHLARCLNILRLEAAKPKRLSLVGIMSSRASSSSSTTSVSGFRVLSVIFTILRPTEA